MTKIPVVFSTDENYAPYCATAIASILKNSEKSTEFEFYVLTTKLSKEIQYKFNELIKIKDCSINFIFINKDDFKACPITRYFALENYLKFKLSSALPNFDKILYLDSDTIILEDISDLFNTNIDRYYSGMVINATVEVETRENEFRLGLPHGYYFNSGVMLVNSKKWREENIEQKLFEWTKENEEKIHWVDQDVINVVLNGFIKELREQYNVQVHFYNNEEAFAKLEEKMHIVHYSGPVKPWNIPEMFLSGYFWEYAKISPFYDELRKKYLLHYFWRLAKMPWRLARKVISKLLLLSINDKGSSKNERHIYDRVEKALKNNSSVFFLQIGANDGVTRDHLHKLILIHKEWTGIFIEPLKHIFAKLKLNYGNFDRFIFENVAIGVTKETKDFYFVSDKAKDILEDCPPWYDQLGSFNNEHISKHFNGKFNPFIVKEKVECVPLSDVLLRNDVTKIDLLQIDTEGFDYKILSQLDFQKYTPKVILFEHKHLVDDEKKKAILLLKNNGYKLYECEEDYLAIKKINLISALKKYLQVKHGFSSGS
jgi:FkbM family methyltransferase